LSTARLKELNFPIRDLDKSRGRYTRAMQEGGMLEGARLLDADAEVVGGVGGEDPFAFVGGSTDEAVEDLLGGDFNGFLLASVARGVGGCLVV